MGLGLSTPSPRWELNSDEVTSAVPGAPETPGNRKSGLVRPALWQVSQDTPARAAWPPSSKGVRKAARPTSTW